MKKFVSILSFLVLLSLTSTSAFAQPLSIPADCSYILMDSKTGQVILESNADQKLRPASTTKIMTAVIALESGALDKEMAVSAKAVNDIGPGGMNIGIMAEEEGFTLEHLVNVMLVRSANETANIIAENVAESREDFVKKMNQKAAELGASNTNFVNPCGKDDAPAEKNHLSSARDMAKIARYAMTLPKFREIVSQEYYKGLPVTNKHQNWPALQNTNKLLWGNNTYPYTLNGVNSKFTVNGIKTGYTNVAGNNLISSAVNEDGMELIAAVMHVKEISNGKGVFTYSKELLKYGFEHFANQKISDANQLIKTFDVQDAKEGSKVDLVTATDFRCALPVDKNDHKIVTKENLPQVIKAPIQKGDVLGSIEYERNGVSLGKVDVIAAQSVEKSVKANLADTTKKVLNFNITKWIIAALALFFSLIILRFTLRRISRRRKRSSFRL
ncbi:MAG: D-alanyl-D-alanine carboxypeptidase [Clostridia bacterium]|nr:D-alanyl-D-alanine carboxypeptidase [Clostridia bacterium]